MSSLTTPEAALAALNAVFNDNDATTLEILDVIDTYAGQIFSDEDLALFRLLPDNAGRQQAIAKGLKEVADLFGDYADPEALKAELSHQVQVEYAKFEFINAVDGAADAAAMAQALIAHVKGLSDERQALITAWEEEAKTNPDVATRVAELKAADYTTVLAEIVKHRDDVDYMAELGARLLVARNAAQDGKFYGDGKIIAALDKATDGIILDSFKDVFNDPDATELDILSVVDDYEDQLFSAADLARFRELPDNAGRQKAIAKGLDEVADLFGDYATLKDLKAEVAHQVAVEHAKFKFINAIDNAADATAMAKAVKDHVKVLSDERQALIAKWEKVDGNAAVAARVAALKADDYTNVLKQIATRLDQSPNFALDVAKLLLTARDAQPDDKFFGDGKIVAALKAASAEINYAPSDPALSPATVAENSANGTVVGDLSSIDPDKDALTFSLLNDAGGRFAVQGNKLVVKNGLLLDYEQATSHQVTVRVFDGKTSVDKILTVSLSDVANETIKVTSGNNVLTGGVGKDKITGGTGKDIIGGGVGNDTLFGGKGKDIFVFDSKLNAKSNRDTIKDFSVKDDSFWLDNAIFKKLGKGTEDKPGKLAKKYFSIDGAKDKNDYINYNSKTGVLSYDADGLGGRKGIDFAKVKAGLKITEKDFFIV